MIYKLQAMNQYILKYPVIKNMNFTFGRKLPYNPLINILYVNQDNLVSCMIQWILFGKKLTQHN
jgi:hypothetical protein